jgi:DNA-binding MarR family transcriptional regulator
MSTIKLRKVDTVNEMKNAPEEVVEAIHTIMHLFRSEQYRALRDGPYDLTHMEGKILAFLARNSGATLSELVAHSGRDKSQLARLIKSLREQGLLQGQNDKEDRRSVRLNLTSEGRAVHQSLRHQVERLSKVAVTGLGPEELRNLVALLQKVRSNLEKPS